MRRRRVAPRFFVFVAILIVAAFLLARPLWDSGSGQALIREVDSSITQSMDCVIIRDESVATSDSTVRIEYIGRENTEVAAGDAIANLYTTGYTESLLTRLEETRQNIQAYHKTLLGTIVDGDLDRMDAIVDICADDFCNLVTQRTRGNLQTVVEQLETAMVNRQDYLRQNKRDDTRLTQLYDEESTRLSSIQSWRVESTADRAGVLSFYIDGYENDLTVAGLDALTAADVRAVLAGGTLANTAQTRQTGLYRIVDQDAWYVALVSNVNSWIPLVGQTYYLQLEGFEDLSYTATVTNVQKTSDTVLAVFRIDQPIGPLIYQRTGRATLSISLKSLAVDTEALYNQDGQIGVWLNDVPGGTFVPVDVLSTEGDLSLIQPVVEGALQTGQQVLVK